MRRIAPGDVSFYIPVRNAARTLAAAIESVHRQSVAPADIFLVVDTRSTDDSLNIARRSGLRIIEQPEGCLGHARNLALTACQTPWLASCDSDVALEPDWLAALITSADPSIAAVGGRTEERLITPADRWRAVNMPHNWGPARFDNPFMLVSEMLARVAAFRAIGGYRADLKYYEDSDACQRIRHAGFVLRYEPAAVAWHDRRDSVASVLELRWQYAAYRQRTRLESLDGLIEKLPINRTYCLQSLSQTLHSPHADACALAILLWFHHAHRDMRAALDQWPLLTAEDRAECDARLRDALHDEVAGRWPRLMALRENLPVLQGLNAERNRAGIRGAHADLGLSSTPGFDRYLSAVRSATRDLASAIPSSLDAALDSSAARLGDPPAGHFQQPALCVAAADQQRLAALTLRPAWRWADVAASMGELPQPQRVVAIGRVLDAELPVGVGRDCSPVGASDAPHPLLLIPHLEQFASPLAELHRALADAATAVVAYQPPDFFMAGVPIVAPRDLAACAAAAGFEIVHFLTQAGLTRLVLRHASRAEPAPRAHTGATHSARPPAPCPV